MGEAVIAFAAIDLQNAFEAPQPVLGVSAVSAGGIGEDDRWGRRAAPGGDRPGPSPQRQPVLVFPAPGFSAGNVASSAKSLPAPFMGLAMRETMGRRWNATLPIQSARVDRSISIPCRANACALR